MSEEKTTEYEEEAENFAQVREKLAEKHHLQQSSPDEPTIRRYPVVGTPDTPSDLEPGDELRLKILVEGENEETVSVPWPENTNDSSEELIRLINSLEVSPTDITELESVPVYTDGDKYELIIPPEDYRFKSEYTYIIEDGSVRAVNSPLKNLAVAISAIFSGVAVLLTSFVFLGVSESITHQLSMELLLTAIVYMVGGSLICLGITEIGLGVLTKYKNIK